MLISRRRNPTLPECPHISKQLQTSNVDTYNIFVISSSAESSYQSYTTALLYLIQLCGRIVLPLNLVVHHNFKKFSTVIYRDIYFDNLSNYNCFICTKNYTFQLFYFFAYNLLQGKKYPTLVFFTENIINSCSNTDTPNQLYISYRSQMDT